MKKTGPNPSAAAKKTPPRTSPTSTAAPLTPAAQTDPAAALPRVAALPTTHRPNPVDILTLQRTVGNRAVNQLLAQRKIQAKLTVGPAHDAYEQEADRVAAQVMAAPTPPAPIAQRTGEADELQTKPLAAAPLAATITPLVQREAAPEDEEELQTKTEEQSSEGGFEPAADFETRLGEARGGGTTLPDHTRDFMEQRMGTEFSGVKVHTDARSDQLNQSIQAKAFTTGHDVFFREGAYQPGSRGGQELIAHELTHVVQQGAAPSTASSVQREVEGDEPAQALQRHANDGAIQREFVASPPAPAPNSVIQRDLVEFAKLGPKEKAPTVDLAHPHLAQLKITDLGPYKYRPAGKNFEYKAPADLAAAWNDTETTRTYQPESVDLTKVDPNVVPFKQSDRIDAAKKKFGPGAGAILSHDDGKTPRAFTSVADEDTLGASLDAHNVARHALGPTSDMKSKHDIALRAAFGMIGGVVKGVYTPIATAFTTVTDANTQVKAALDASFRPQVVWEVNRLQLAAGKKVEPLGPAPTGGVVAFRSKSGLQLPEAEVPIYLNLGNVNHKGIKPMWAGDAAWQTWWDTKPPERLQYEKVNGVDATPDPLTDDVTGNLTKLKLRVLAQPTPAAAGWIVHSAYPTE